MNKKLIVITFAVAFMVPYGAKLLAKKDKSVEDLKEKIKKLDNKIETLQKSLDASADLCEKTQTRGACEFAAEDVSVKGIELDRLKDKRDALQKELDGRTEGHKKSKKGKKQKKETKQNK